MRTAISIGFVISWNLSTWWSWSLGGLFIAVCVLIDLWVSSDQINEYNARRSS